jgi:hypothetical protein
MLAEEFNKAEKYLQQILKQLSVIKNEADVGSFVELGKQIVKTRAQKEAISELFTLMNTQLDEGNPITVKYPQILTAVTGTTQLC